MPQKVKQRQGVSHSILAKLGKWGKRLAYNYQDMDYKFDEMPKTEALSK
ncbi:hypothetical protein [Hoylesella shahii]|nr:hypothetical protein [Hoylesella shahii]